MRTWLILAGIFGALGVAIGAFAAHVLKAPLTAAGVFDTFEVGVRYHMYHSLALLAVAWLADRQPGPLIRWAGALLVVGIVLFSGSLYAYCLTDVKWLVRITPFGGGAFILAWILLAVAGGRAARPAARPQ